MHLFFQFMSKTHVDIVAKKMYTDFVKDTKSLKKRIKAHQDLVKEMDAVWKKHQKEKNILKTYEKLLKPAVKWWYYGIIGEDKGHVIDAAVVPNFEKRYGMSKQEARDIVHLLMHPEEQSAFNIERKLFLTMCLDYLNSKNIQKKIKEYIKEFFWIKTTFYKSYDMTPQNLLEEIKKEIKHSSKKKIQEEITQIEENFKKIHKEKKLLIKKLKLTRQDKQDIEFAELTTYWIDQRKIGMMKHFHYFLDLLKEISEKFEIDYSTLTLYTVKEVRSLLKTGKKVDKKLINKRYDSIMNVYERDNKVSSFFGKEGYMLYKLASEVKVKEIKGLVASRTDLAKITGKARIIEEPLKQKFNKGDILVTSMTRIEFVPLMRKAKAIITNEGGISCHAAIVSRELGIPCIIGTRVATRILKNGDKVELDMEEGVVKKR
ncbi:hypothetical protein KY331_04840 [Candidatus Woesearchaeota archaeon]|nr:hypothetical protein [Candidatus Woesearchaeota archaeon]